MSLLTSDAPSLNPTADHLLGNRGRKGFLKSLSACCAHAIAQTCPTHPMHKRVMQHAADSRDGFKRLLAKQSAAKQRAKKAA